MLFFKKITSSDETSVQEESALCSVYARSGYGNKAVTKSQVKKHSRLNTALVQIIFRGKTRRRIRQGLFILTRRTRPSISFLLILFAPPVVPAAILQPLTDCAPTHMHIMHYANQQKHNVCV